jgi:DNA-binding CsgD family transcriptional regulator
VPDSAAAVVHLSRRQEQIVSLLAKGKSDKEIAWALGLSPATIRTYLQRLYRRHGLQGRAHAVAVVWRTS